MRRHQDRPRESDTLVPDDSLTINEGKLLPLGTALMIPDDGHLPRMVCAPDIAVSGADKTGKGDRIPRSCCEKAHSLPSEKSTPTILQNWISPILMPSTP